MSGWGGEEDLGGVGGGETRIRTHCMGREIHFLLKKKKRNWNFFSDFEEIASNV